MEAFSYCGVDVQHGKQSTKRKRYDEPDDRVPAKRHLTEDAMAAFMHQLNLSSGTSLPSPPSPLTPAPLNITTVTSCPATKADTSYCTRRPAHNSCRSSVRGGVSNHRLTPPREDPRETKLVGSAVTEGLDLASTLSRHPVHIRVTPATPPSSESSGSPHQDDCEPMEQSSFSRHHCKQRVPVVLEDISSDSSDNEMTQRVWIAPEIQMLTTSQRPFLVPPILDEIAKSDMAVVPWVKREHFFTGIIGKTKAQVSSEETSSGSEEPEFQEDDKQWDCNMHFD